MPNVSVIVPVYNVEPYLRRCLESLIHQTLKDIEIIVINDCSTDGSLEILKEYAKQDERIKLIDLPVNQGAAVARNKGLEAASGEYLGFIDPDDDLDLNFYEELYKKAHSENLDTVKCNRVIRHLDGEITRSRLNRFIKSSLYDFSYEWQSAIYRASLIYDNNIKFPPDVRKGQDVVFLNKIILKVKKYAVIDNVNYYYYKRENSLNAKKIPIESIKSALLAAQYIIQSLNSAFEEGSIKEEDYIKCYFGRLAAILAYTMEQTDDKEGKNLCVKKFLELYKQCKNQKELKNKIYIMCKEFVPYIENDDVESILEFFDKYKSFQGYLLSTMRENVKKDITSSNAPKVKITIPEALGEKA